MPDCSTVRLFDCTTRFYSSRVRDADECLPVPLFFLLFLFSLGLERESILFNLAIVAVKYDALWKKRGQEKHRLDSPTISVQLCTKGPIVFSLRRLFFANNLSFRAEVPYEIRSRWRSTTAVYGFDALAPIAQAHMEPLSTTR